MKYLHTMVRVTDLELSLRFYRDALGLEVLRVQEVYTGGRNFGHIAYAVDDIYAVCARLLAHGVTLSRPPRDGAMAFVRSPDNISIELLQAGHALPPAEPWVSLRNVGAW
jgi:lactoylglutathione lyase